MSNYARTILLTGGTSGLGFEIATQVAKQRPDLLIVVASRSENGAVNKIQENSGTGNVEHLSLDLLHRDDVRDFADKWTERQYEPIHALILNAGQQSPLGYSLSEDGFEKTFAIGHMGHALLFALMRPHLADDVRIIITSSGSRDPAQKLTGMPHPRYESAEKTARPSPCPKTNFKTRGLERYTTTKLATLLWMYALHRRVEIVNKKTGKTWSVFASDPGLMPSTGLFRDAPAPFRFVFGQVLSKSLPILRATYHHHVWTPMEAGAEFAKLALGPEGEQKGGRYFEGAKEIKSSVESYDEAKQEDMWTWTLANVPGNEQERQLLGFTDLM
jgi:NAD(P)-dependent dehydrogenase (short-subunit alcohol dehydrogenase family)